MSKQKVNRERAFLMAKHIEDECTIVRLYERIAEAENLIEKLDEVIGALPAAEARRLAGYVLPGLEVGLQEYARRIEALEMEEDPLMEVWGGDLTGEAGEVDI